MPEERWRCPLSPVVEFHGEPLAFVPIMSGRSSLGECPPIQDGCPPKGFAGDMYPPSERGCPERFRPDIIGMAERGEGKREVECAKPPNATALYHLGRAYERLNNPAAMWRGMTSDD